MLMLKKKNQSVYCDQFIYLMKCTLPLHFCCLKISNILSYENNIRVTFAESSVYGISNTHSLPIAGKIFIDLFVLSDDIFSAKIF